MTKALAETLSMIAQAVQDAQDPWWLIGSAAVALHGAKVAHLKDVDLMMSARDADAFLRRVKAHRERAESSDRFSSHVFGIWGEPPIPVEAFGGFRVANGGVWREVLLSTREPIRVGKATVFVPAARELITLLRAFGRPKDLERANLLRALAA